MKKNLTRITSLLLVFCLIFLSACQNSGKAPAKTPEEFWARPHEWQSEQLSYYSASNEHGYYYQDANEVLMYLDYATREKVALCSSVNCKHSGAGCEAYMPGPMYIFSYENKLYLIRRRDDGTHIYQCNLDATDRESKIILMQDEMEKGNAAGLNSCVLNGDELYYLATYQEPTKDAAGKIKDPIKAVRRVDLKTWKDEEICRSVEFEYRITGADADGVLIFERPDIFVVTKDKEVKEGMPLLTREEKQELSIKVFYWDKKTGSKLNLYESNFFDTYYIAFAKGSCLYRLGMPDGSTVTSLEKMDMHTGETEWLWREKAGPLSMPMECWPKGNLIYLIINKGDGTYPQEIYTMEDFKKVELPFLKADDDIMFHSEHGYVVDRLIEKRSDISQNGDVVDYIFVPMEEANKKNPEYTVLFSYGRD